MTNQFKFSVHEIDGLIYLREYGGKQKIFKTRKELADYISPRTIAQATPAAPPFPSNQASAMNINAANQYCGGVQYSMSNQYNALDYLAGQQYNCSISSASLPKQYDCNNCKGIKNQDGSCGCKSNAEKIKSDMEQQWRAREKQRQAIDNILAEQDKIQKEHDAENKPEEFIGDKLRHMIEFAVKAGYGNNLAQFAADVKALREQANLQDDGK